MSGPAPSRSVGKRAGGKKRPAKKAAAKKAAGSKAEEASSSVLGPVETAVRADLEGRESAHPMADSLRAIAFALAARMDQPGAQSTLDKAARELSATLQTLAGSTPPVDDPVADELGAPVVVSAAGGDEASA